MVAFIVVVYVWLTVVTYRMMLRMSEITLVPVREGSGESTQEAETPTEAGQWAQSNHFEFVGQFNTSIGSQKGSVAAWRHTERPSFFCEYIIIGPNAEMHRAFDLETIFGFNVELNTASTADGHLQPKPGGSYVQSFSEMSFDDRWGEHIKSENYLMDVGGAELVQEEIPFEDHFIESTREQVEYVRSLRFWPFRWAYWYFVRRRLWHNRSIEMQHKKGMIKMPNEA